MSCFSHSPWASSCTPFSSRRCLLGRTYPIHSSPGQTSLLGTLGSDTQQPFNVSTSVCTSPSSLLASRLTHHSPPTLLPTTCQHFREGHFKQWRHYAPRFQKVGDSLSTSCPSAPTHLCPLALTCPPPVSSDSGQPTSSRDC